MMLANKAPRHLPRQQGYTLLEILVALFIGVFLLAGLFTILQNTRRTSSQQTALTQLQDQQRMALSILGDVIQNAGYFDPKTTSATVAFSAVAASTYASGYAMAVGQGLSGSDAGAGDIIVARFATNGSEGMINCNGATSSAATTFTNMFYIAPYAGASGGYALYCSLNGTTASGIPLVTGVENMQIYYGVATVAGANNVDTYMTATQVQASSGGWASVTSVRVTLSFINPFYGQAGYSASTNKYIYLTRVIPIQGRTGVIATQL